MPTTFIAVQCFQCFTMQVKQQKKSSNKWTCVVCNEKQSVQKVFAKGFMAKDVRKFVQNFNMSRQLAEQKPEEKLFVQNYDEEENEQIGDIFCGNQFSCNEGKRKKRTDWSEYVDYEEDSVKLEHTEVDGFEPMVVTEMPKAMFKKPKLKNYSTGGSGFEDGEKLYEPVFAKRQSTAHSLDVEPFELQEKTNIKFQPSDTASKWSRFKRDIQDHQVALLRKRTASSKGSLLKSSTNITQDADENFAFKAPPLNPQITAKGPVSKWSNYITDTDDDNLLIREGKTSLDWSSNQWKNDEFETLLSDQRVEEDIHPDFL